MSQVLAIECAVTGLAVAVVRDGTRLACRREHGRDQSARLLPAIVEALAEAAIERRSLSLIAVTVGPGSFTGVRVGLAAARGLALGLAIPLAGIATTRVLLAQAPRDERVTLAAIDSRLGDWFVATSVTADRPFIATTAELVRRLEGQPSRVVGPEAEALAEPLRKAGLDVVAHAAPPDAVVLAGLAAVDGVEAWRLRNRRDGLPRPLYLRGVHVTSPDGVRRTVE